MGIPTSSVEVREKIIQRAISQLGVNESPANSNRTPYTKWYGLVGPWCAMFVSWCFYFSGLPLPITTEKGFAYCPYGVNWFKKNGAWAGPNVKPKRGWVVFYDFIGRPSHVGIVEGIATDGRIVALEGNTNAAGSRTGGSVMRHHRRISSGIVGYGIINYTETEKPAQAAPTKKGISMEAALLLIKIHYDNIRGGGTGSYDVAKSDRKGWQHWVQALLEAQDSNTPLSDVTDSCALLLIKNEGQK